MRVEEFGSSPSFQQCLKIGQIAGEAFKDDPIMRHFSPPEYRIIHLMNNIGLITDPKEKLDEIQRLSTVWKYNILLYSWHWYKVLSRPGFRTFIGYNENDVPVSVAVWSIPYPLREQSGWLDAIRIHLRQLRAWIHHKWIQWWYPGLNPRALPICGEVLSALDKDLGLTDHAPRDEDELINMADEKRRDSIYCKDLSYYLAIFACSEQGKGYGSQLFRNMKLEPKPFEFSGVQFSPQLILVASPMGLPLYKKFGYREISAATHTVGGEPFRRDLMIYG